MAVENTSQMATDRKNLDPIDLKILALLQGQARISMKALSAAVGLSVTPCIERVRRLERDRVIRGYHARLDPQALGQNLLVFVEIKLSSKSGEVFDKVKKELLHMPEVLECHLVSGGFDYLVKARLRGMGEYRHLLGNILKRLPVTAASRSVVVMEEVKESLHLPLDR